MATFEAGPGADERDHMGAGDDPSAGLGGLAQLKTIANPAAR
ncbi:hypothetical protein [Streptomyces sp. NPDC050485]